jgi:type II secretory pathway predicted ATPase ExeA
VGNAKIHGQHVNERAPKPPLADDPNFSASLSDLDRGLIDDPVPKVKVAPQPPAKPLPEEPSGLSPAAAAALAAASEALSAFDVPPAPDNAAIPAGEPRKLIDLAARRPLSAPILNAVSERETFYGLADTPFGLSPDLRFRYHGGSHDRVLRDLTAAVGRRDGAIVLTGEFCVGKTTLCRALVDQLGRRTLVSFVAESFSSVQELLKTVLVDFGVISRADVVSGRLMEASQDDLAAKLRGFLESLTALQAVALLIIDDAQKLPAAVLGELQSALEIAAEQKLLQVLIVGEPELATLLRSAHLRKVDSRISLRSELGPLTAEEVPAYVAHRLAVAGGPGRATFADAALARVYSLSQGTPRIVNLICDRTLTMGYRASAHLIDEELVNRAARDLGLLPEAGHSTAASLWRGRLLMVLLMLGLMLAGAAGAGWTFRGPLMRALARWHVVR